MSHKTKKLSPSKYKGKGLLMYQNQWHQSKLTKKQVKQSKYKVKVHSTEQGQPISKYRMLKTTIPDWIQERNKKKEYFRNFSRTKTTQTDFKNNQGKEFQFGANCIKGTSQNRHLNLYKQATVQTTVQKSKEQATGIFLSGNFMPNTKINKHSGLEAKKVFRRMVKRQWFFDQAAPIPGVSSLKKRKRLYSTKQRAFKTIQSWLEVYNKKQMKAFFGVQKMQNLTFVHKNWRAILLMESMYQSNFRKRAFTQNAQQRNALAHSQLTTVNGNFVKKLRFVNFRADQSIPKNIPTTLNKVQSFYAPKKLVFFLPPVKKSVGNFVFHLYPL